LRRDAEQVVQAAAEQFYQRYADLDLTQVDINSLDGPRRAHSQAIDTLLDAAAAARVSRGLTLVTDHDELSLRFPRWMRQR
jgi:hypothetical protein